MACHSATNGQGFAEFSAWCQSDARYAGDDTIETRWDSFKPDGGIGIGTFFKVAGEAIAGIADETERMASQTAFDAIRFEIDVARLPDDLPPEVPYVATVKPVERLRVADEQYAAACFARAV